ncbi:hypothetical protein L209DRAFT_752730 [Thermothelomyces heterothallicus CBS 203.75]
MWKPSGQQPRLEPWQPQLRPPGLQADYGICWADAGASRPLGGHGGHRYDHGDKGGSEEPYVYLLDLSLLRRWMAGCLLMSDE